MASSIPAVLDAIRAGLVARAGLAGVSVQSGPFADPGQDGIELVRVESDEEPAAMAPTRPIAENYTIIGHIKVHKTGSGETTIKSARDQAFDWLDEIREYLKGDHRIGNRVQMSALGFDNLDQGPEGTNRVLASIRFAIQIQARI